MVPIISPNNLVSNEMIFIVNKRTVEDGEIGTNLARQYQC